MIDCVEFNAPLDTIQVISEAGLFAGNAAFGAEVSRGADNDEGRSGTQRGTVEVGDHVLARSDGRRAAREKHNGRESHTGDQSAAAAVR